VHTEVKFNVCTLHTEKYGFKKSQKSEEKTKQHTVHENKLKLCLKFTIHLQYMCSFNQVNSTHNLETETLLEIDFNSYRKDCNPFEKNLNPFGK